MRDDRCVGVCGTCGQVAFHRSMEGAPPVRRRLRYLLRALSALLCAAVCVLWVRSYFVFRNTPHAPDSTPSAIRLALWTGLSPKTCSAAGAACSWRYWPLGTTT